MYTKSSEDQVTFLSKVPDDEPIFILRARDALAIETISAWMQRAGTLGVNAQKLADAASHLIAFKRWAEQNPTRLPD